MSTSNPTDATQARAIGAQAVWPGFVRASVWLAGMAGFGLGAALFAVGAFGLPIGAWWPASAQAHGHIQLFGWAGLMVLGVGLHFLPRLRGTTLAHPGRARYTLALLVAGLVLRAFSQPPLASVSTGTPLSAVLTVSLVGSGVLEIVGACLVLWMLGDVLRHGPPLRTRAGLWPVLPFFLTAFTAYLAALAVNLGGLCVTPAAGALVPDRLDDLTEQIAIYGFLAPIAVAMSERTFPLFFRTPLPRHRLLRAGLALLLVGLGARIVGNLLGARRLAGVGEMTLAAAICLFILALGVFAPRRPLPRRPVRPLHEPIQLHAITAYLWLVVVALLLIQDGLAAIGFPIAPVPADAEPHALGAGFVTLLILGLGAQLLPGFANRRLRSARLVWATLALGNLAALLRVGPLLLPALIPAGADAVLSLAGIAALAALVIFGINVPTAPRR